jgi:branched-chain amino acid transport system substrate-binding protein
MNKTVQILRSTWTRFLSFRPEIRWLIVLGLIAIAPVTRLALRSFRNEPPDSVIKIGAILPQTGPGAVFAQYIQEGSELAAEEINARQAKPVKIIYEDSKNLPREGVTVYNRLVARDHPRVVMVALSSVAKALAPLAAESNTAQVYVAVAIPDITDGKYTFRVYPEASGMAGLMAHYSFENLNKRTAAIFYVNDDFGRVSVDAYRKEFELHGGKVVYAESYELQETDFRAQISKLKNLDPAPDVIYLNGYGPAYGVAIRQLREQQVTAQITADMTMGLPNTREQVGSAADGIYFVDGKISDEFAKKFWNKYHKEPSSYAGYSYDIIQLLNRATQTKNDVTTASVVDGLRQVRDYSGAMGKISILTNGDSSLQFVVKKMTGSAIEVVSDPDQQKSASR